MFKLFIILCLSGGFQSYLATAVHETSSDIRRPIIPAKQNCELKESNPELEDENGRPKELPHKTIYSLNNESSSVAIWSASKKGALSEERQKLGTVAFIKDLEAQANSEEYWDSYYPVISPEDAVKKEEVKLIEAKKKITEKIDEVYNLCRPLAREYEGPFRYVLKGLDRGVISMDVTKGDILRGLNYFYPPRDPQMKKILKDEEVFNRKIAIPFMSIKSVSEKLDRLSTQYGKNLAQIDTLEKSIKVLNLKERKSIDEEEKIGELVRELGDLSVERSNLEMAIAAINGPTLGIFDKNSNDPEMAAFFKENKNYFKGLEELYKKTQEWDDLESRFGVNIQDVSDLKFHLDKFKQSYRPKLSSASLMLANVKSLNFGYVIQYRKTKNNSYEFLSLAPVSGERKPGQSQLFSVSVVEEGSPEDKNEMSRLKKIHEIGSKVFKTGYKFDSKQFLLCDSLKFPEN